MSKAKPSADIRRFTGFIAPDGTTHDSIKKATDHTRDLKIKAALADFALVALEVNEGVSTHEGHLVIFTEDLPAFLLAHKADILAAFNQDVLMRAPRQFKAKAVAAAENFIKSVGQVPSEAFDSEAEEITMV